MTDTPIVRAARRYIIQIEAEGGGATTQSYVIPAGTEAEQDAAAEAEADVRADDWMSGGEWGDEGASVTCWITMTDDEDYAWETRSHQTEIDPDHRALIAEATRGYKTCGDDPDAHAWTRKGEGGLIENPGVWATGGTSLCLTSHCTCCGLRRIVHVTGSQRNPGECDTVRYQMRRQS